MTKAQDWPLWLQLLLGVPHAVLASVMCWLWWPKTDKEWRLFGFLVAYLLLALTFYMIFLR